MQDEKVFIEALLNPKTQQEAFRELLQLYQKPLYNHIRNIVLNHDDTDDILQNTFIKVFENLKNTSFHLLQANTNPNVKYLIMATH